MAICSLWFSVGIFQSWVQHSEVLLAVIKCWGRGRTRDRRSRAVRMSCSSHLVARVPVSSSFFFFFFKFFSFFFFWTSKTEKKQTKHLPKKEVVLFFFFSSFTDCPTFLWLVKRRQVSVAVNGWCHFHLSTQKWWFGVYFSPQTRTDLFDLSPWVA